MNLKKFQVFISSPFKDLMKERSLITEILLSTNCIPAGMEYFAAADDEQFEIIKQVIDLCDYFILVIGTRYGTINEKTGKSYTEMEFDYALSKNIPILVFAKNIDLNTEITTDDLETRMKLLHFRNRALKDRLGGFWSSSEELVRKVAASISMEIQACPRPGWIRNQDYNPERVAQKRNTLHERVNIIEENTQLRAINLAQYSLKLHYTENFFLITLSSPPPRTMEVEITLEELFKHISIRISGSVNDNSFIDIISTYVPGYYVDTQQALVIKNQLITLGMLEEFDNGKTSLVKLSQLGKETMRELNALQVTI